MALSIGGGAAQGLEVLFKRDREEEELRRLAEQVDLQRQRDEANRRFQDEQLSIQRATSERLGRTADLDNQLKEIQLSALSRLQNPAQASANPNVASPSHPIPVSGFSNTPEGRFTVSAAGHNPNEVFGAIQTARPEDMTPEETFYQGKATTQHGLQSWRQLPPDDLARYRKEWELIRPPSQSTFVVPVYDPNTNQSVWTNRADAVGQPVNPPAGQRDRISAYESALALLDQIEEQGAKVSWGGLGPIEAPFDSIATKLGAGNFVSKDPEGEERLRALLAQLKAQTSFAEGGKQFTGTEKELLDKFITAAESDIQQIRPRLGVARDAFRRGLESLGQVPRGSRTNSNQNPPGSGDPYQQYLDSLKRRSGGGQ